MFRKMILSVIVIAGAWTQAQASMSTETNVPLSDSRYYEVRSMTTNEVFDSNIMAADPAAGEAATTTPGCDPANPLKKDKDPIGEAEDVIDRIINIGKKIWAVVESGRAVVNYKTDVATAMPQGVKCWTDLQGWAAPQSRTYETSFINGYGTEVVKFKYRVIWIFNGSKEGKGAYIGYATAIPVNMEVAWGFNFDAEASVPAVFNQGDKQNPIAGMQMIMKYRVTNVLTNISQSQAYFINGQGQFKTLD